MIDSTKFHEFQYELRLLIGAMERTIQRTYPPVTVPGSQYGEDKILAGLLPEAAGFYVDVGASHPVECSNTKLFYDRGWRGLLVECLPSAWHSLLRQRPGDFLSPLAAMDAPGFARLRVSGSVSSTRIDWDIAEQAELIVECDTLASILAPFPEIREKCSLLSLDVEGAEAQALRGIDWSAFHPKVIVIEAAKYHGDPKAVKEDLSGEWSALLVAQGYRRHWKNELNQIWKRG